MKMLTVVNPIEINITLLQAQCGGGGVVVVFSFNPVLSHLVCFVKCSFCDVASFKLQHPTDGDLGHSIFTDAV